MGDGFDQAEGLVKQMQEKLQGFGGMQLPGGAGITAGLEGVFTAGLMVAAALLALRFTGASLPTLALREFTLRPDAFLDAPMLTLAGRSRGLGGWILTMLGLNPVSTLVVTRQSVRSDAASLFGSRVDVFPLDRVASFAAGSYRPINYLVAAPLAVVIGWRFGSIGLLVGLLIAALCAGRYFLAQQFFIEFRSSGAAKLGFAFQTNLIEGVRVDLERMMRAADAVDALLQKTGPGRRPVDAAVGPAPESYREEPVPAPNVFQPEPAAPRIRLSPVLAPIPSPLAAAPPAQAPTALSKPKPERRPLTRAAARPATAEEEKLAGEALTAAARVFESGRHQDAENAWKAIIRRWPNSDAALRSRRILKNRRRDNAAS
ncbi:MAG TPA: hypothetical protein VNC50_05830 [Planctomycetia bacterium]|nr:hypothetical protein [Planctomycetia bacterium]